YRPGSIFQAWRPLHPIVWRLGSSTHSWSTLRQSLDRLAMLRTHIDPRPGLFSCPMPTALFRATAAPSLAPSSGPPILWRGSQHVRSQLQARVLPDSTSLDRRALEAVPGLRLSQTLQPLHTCRLGLSSG